MPSTKEIAARQALVGEYLAAFKLANPKKPAPELHYENGWFYLKYGHSTDKHRKTKLEACATGCWRAPRPTRTSRNRKAQHEAGLEVLLMVGAKPWA